MSHFTVLVIGSDEFGGVEGLLQPFHEFECTGENDEYVQDIDQTEEVRIEYERDSQGYFVLSNGEKVAQFDDRFYRDFTDEEIEQVGMKGKPPMGCGCGKGISWYSKYWSKEEGRKAKVYDPDPNLELKHRSPSDIQTLAEFVKSYYGHNTITEGEESSLDMEGEYKYGYTVVDKDGNLVKSITRTNPNRKWDWWQIGGRWSGCLKLKQETLDKVKDGQTVEGVDTGSRSLIAIMNGAEDIPLGFVDQAKMKDIDWDGMEMVAKKKAADSWTEYQAKCREELQKQVANGETLRFDDNIYHPDGGIYNYLYGVEEGDNKDRYIDRNKHFSTFAVLVDGKWYERGEMGWFGMAFDEKEPDRWQEEFTKLVRQQDPETLITVVDCHI